MKKFIPMWHVFGLTTAYVFLSFNGYYSSVVVLLEWKIDTVEVWDLSTTMLVDSLNMSFLFTVFMVSAMVFVYSYSYLDKDLNKFITLLLLFVTSMCVLCLSPTLYWAMLGWDGLGLTSFCLIVFYQNWSSFMSGLVTFLINRLGDMFLIMSMGLMISSSSVMSHSLAPSSLLSVLFIMGLMTKSAQLPFSSWLPLAMAAPTPVSSLVHSSTLVTAGVYLLIRFSSLMTPLSMHQLNLVASVTIIYSGIMALLDYDLKKIIAFSTMMHLGVMMLFVSVGSQLAALIHMMFHAMFKSALFMLSGALIHMSGLQDVRMIKSPPVTKSMMAYVCASMAGLPFLTGFYSKEVMMSLLGIGPVSLAVVFMMSVMMTMSYSMRLYILVSKSNNMTLSMHGEHTHTMMMGVIKGLTF